MSITQSEFETAKQELGNDITEKEAIQYISWRNTLNSSFDESKLLKFIEERLKKVFIDIADPRLDKESNMMECLRAEVRFMMLLQKMLNSKKNSKKIASSGLKKFENN